MWSRKINSRPRNQYIMSNSIVFNINDVYDYPTYRGNLESLSKPVKESNKIQSNSENFQQNNQENIHLNSGNKKENLLRRVDSDFLKILIYLKVK
jgi:hypothetical protein